MRKNQRPYQLNDLCTFQQSCVASQIPVRALKYYRRYMTKHPDAPCSFQLKTTTRARSLVQPLSLDGFAPLKSGFSCRPSEQQEYPRKCQSSRGLWSGYFLQLFNKVDLQAVMKARR